MPNSLTLYLLIYFLRVVKSAMISLSSFQQSYFLLSSYSIFCPPVLNENYLKPPRKHYHMIELIPIIEFLINSLSWVSVISFQTHSPDCKLPQPQNEIKFKLTMSTEVWFLSSLWFGLALLRLVFPPLY